MCTAITYKTKEHYFGRNLDLEYSYQETVTVTPRNYRFELRKAGVLESHFAMIGMAYVQDGYPLYYEATNEKGLSMAGLNFPGNAYYGQEVEGKDNIASFEFIPWILGQCESVTEAKVLLEKLQLVNIAFREDLPPTPLHWMIADKDCSITVEAVREGLKIYENPIGVLTNNPTFDYHMMNLNNYMSLSNQSPRNLFAKDVKLKEYSRGMGALGLPGDLSSASRFVRAAFTKLNSVMDDVQVGKGAVKAEAIMGAQAGEVTVTGDEEQYEAVSVNQFFHILGSVEMTRGALQMPSGLYEITVYSSCCNVDKGVYYYTTYENKQIHAVDMWKEELEGDKVVSYPLQKQQNIVIQN